MKKTLYFIILFGFFSNAQTIINSFSHEVSGSSFPLDDAVFVVSYYAEDLGADASAISSWADRKGSNNAVQATGAKQPLVDIESDGKKAVAFDGSDDGLEITEVTRLNPAPGDPLSMVLVTGEKSWSPGDTFAVFKGSTSSSATGPEFGFYITTGPQLQGNVYGAPSGNQSKTTDGVDVWIVTSDGSTAELYQNGSLVRTWSVGTRNLSTNIWLGSRLGAAKEFDGSIRAFAYADSEIDGTLMTAINSYTW